VIPEEKAMISLILIIPKIRKTGIKSLFMNNFKKGTLIQNEGKKKILIDGADYSICFRNLHHESFVNGSSSEVGAMEGHGFGR
jgi:hypothetical protein